NCENSIRQQESQATNQNVVAISYFQSRFCLEFRGRRCLPGLLATKVGKQSIKETIKLRFRIGDLCELTAARCVIACTRGLDQYIAGVAMVIALRLSHETPMTLQSNSMTVHRTDLEA